MQLRLHYKAARVGGVRRYIVKRISIVFIGLIMSSHSFAWDAKCTMSGEVLEIEWPHSPYMVAQNGNHEIQYKFKGESGMRLGEVTGWLSKCYGRFCPSGDTNTFELNTFSERGLLYCYPIAD